jgi:hypothetical protein
MRKLTVKMKERIENEGLIVRNWDAGAKFDLYMDWDCEDHIINAEEVLKDLKRYLRDWPGIEKYGVKREIGGRSLSIWIDYTR